MSEVSERALAHLDAWFSQRPTFALMGEFSAGKSTLLNLILGEKVLPTQVTATSMPVIWMTYGEVPSAHSLSFDGVLQEFDFEDFSSQGGKGHLLIRLALPSELLKRSDVIDTPGISDRRLAAGALDFIKPYLDFVVWCSAANQAWRQSEKVVWQDMRTEAKDLSILALTRADTMTKPGDLAKVIKRCETETAGMFRLVQPIATVVALSALDENGEVKDPTAWATSHADALFSAIKDSLRISKLNCALREVVEIPEDTPETEQPKIVEPPVERVQPSAANDIEEDPQSGVSNKADNLVRQLRLLPENTSTKEQFLDTLDHLLTEFRCDLEPSDAHQLVLGRAMSLDGSGNVPPHLVISQLVREIEDFANKPWCQLDKVH